MPDYTYKCEKCQDEFEIHQTLDEKPIKKCRKCNGKLSKIIGIPMVFMRHRTVGAVADNNDVILSNDHKNSITPKKNKKNKKQQTSKPDPEYDKHIRKIGKLNKEQANKYIETGRID